VSIHWAIRRPEDLCRGCVLVVLVIVLESTMYSSNHLLKVVLDVICVTPMLAPQQSHHYAQDCQVFALFHLGVGQTLERVRALLKFLLASV